MLKKDSIKQILNAKETDALCQQYLNLIYHKMRGHGLTHRKKHVTETYGEILYPSVNVLLTEINLGKQDVFLDLGSGLGKVVLQVFLKSQVKEAGGIEIIPELHQQAQIAAQQVKNDLPVFFAEDRKLNFLCGNFLELSLQHPTVILIGSPCFSPKIISALGKMIEHTKSIHSVLTLRPIPRLKRLSFKKSVRIECSWDTALCYVYKAK